MAELRDVLDLVKRYRAHGITLNIETKVEAGAPSRPRRVSCSSGGSSRRSGARASSGRSPSSPSTGARCRRCTGSRRAGRSWR
ncbi:hypothetical protein V2I01_20465 [Micromonospora sp. BRA006-A]|nr:hypothetical protein [Micromonospora sp. BRA006-A]